MNSTVDYLVNKCLLCGYITQEKILWLRYVIEKRISSFVVMVPFIILGSLLSGWEVAVTFLSGFCYLRKRTSGLHARTVIGCMILSLVFEYLFLGVLFKHLDYDKTVILTVVSSLAVFTLVLGAATKAIQHPVEKPI